LGGGLPDGNLGSILQLLILAEHTLTTISAPGTPVLLDYDLLFRGAPSRLLVLDAAPAFTIVEASDAWLRSRKLRRESVVGRDYFEAFPDDTRALRPSLERVLATRAADDRNAPILTWDGTLRFIIHRDAVELDLLESEHQRDEAIRKLKAAKQELEAFAYSASHDLRSPLRAISAYCSMLRSLEPGTLPPMASDLLARMEGNVRTMAAIIDGLLELTRVDTTKMNRRRVDITGSARRIARELQAHDASRHVDVVVADGLEALADDALVSILLHNLIGNAWKYTAKRRDARIEVGRRKVVGRDVFYVRDNGAGFDMSRADKLFTPFFRLHAAAEFEGHGIGLATVRRVVERHGGEAWAESRPGEGTTLNFTLG
jgi:signal transduction histidine kinase